MNYNTAIKFLNDHKYMPENSPQCEIDQLEKVRDYFIKNPNPKCVPLFFELFGNHMGWGIFQLCDDVFRKYPNDVIVSQIKASLLSNNVGTRWWAAHWSVEFNGIQIRTELINLLKSKEDEDAHYFLISALGNILKETGDNEVKTTLTYRRNIETDPENMELLDEILGMR